MTALHSAELPNYTLLMIYTAFLTWCLLTSAVVVVVASPPKHKPSRWIPGPTHDSDALAQRGLRNLRRCQNAQSSAACTLKSAYRRKEWDRLTSQEKIAYVKAVECLQTTPSISGDLAPGAKSRFDDFQATHINQTLIIHNTGNFLAWHRYYIYAYETALREECGYKGYQPYINWARLSNSVTDAPIFDGSVTSLGSNGAYSSDRIPFILLSSPNVTTPAVLDPQGGGGCLKSGPFANTKTNLGPTFGLLGYSNSSSIPPNPRADGLGYNPRCVRRDLSLQSAQGANDANITSLITSSPTVGTFQDTMQNAFSFSPSQYGVHTAGHYIVGGDPGGDFFTSPGDPWFWLHHAQIDRVWWIWQNQKLPERLKEVEGTITLSNQPPSREAKLEDVMDLGVNDGFEGITIGEGLSTTGGKYCYVYE